jgi:hypothetical protein
MTDLAATVAPPIAASTEAKKPRSKAIVKFPVKFHFQITDAMADALSRLTGHNSLLNESDIGRLALHSYLCANDPQYVAALRNGHG